MVPKDNFTQVPGAQVWTMNYIDYADEAGPARMQQSCGLASAEPHKIETL